MSDNTPWGRAESSRRLGPGIVVYATPSHGGFKLDPERNAEVHPAWRCEDGWYEEDCDWAIVAYHFPHCFSEEERRRAIRTLGVFRANSFYTVSGLRLFSEKESKMAEVEAFAGRIQAAAKDLVAAVGAGDRQAVSGYLNSIHSTCMSAHYALDSSRSVQDWLKSLEEDDADTAWSILVYVCMVAGGRATAEDRVRLKELCHRIYDIAHNGQLECRSLMAIHELGMKWALEESREENHEDEIRG